MKRYTMKSKDDRIKLYLCCDSKGVIIQQLGNVTRWWWVPTLEYAYNECKRIIDEHENNC